MGTTRSGTTSRLIALAVLLAGDPEKVRARMRCSAEEFQDYSAGTTEALGQHFERLVSLIIDEQASIIRARRERVPPVQSKS